MPLYEIQHTIPLTISQKDELAQAITHIHSEKFTTPKLFVNVSFTDTSQAWTYVGGRRQTGNHIRGTVRAGPTRTQQDWNELCIAIQDAWTKIAGTPLPTGKYAANGTDANGSVSQDTSLRSVIVVGGIIAGLEAGFVLPPAGGDVQWLEENWATFNEKAEGGDEDFKGLVEEVKERGLMDGTGGMKTAQQRLEEMLGWGDAA